MKLKVSTGIVSAALAVATLIAAPAHSADLSSWGRGSIKDYHPAPAASPVGSCYFRADVGYAAYSDPTLQWSAWNGAVYNKSVSRTSMDDTMTAGAGVGCGSGSRGLRGELMLGYHGERDIKGMTSPYLNALAVNGGTTKSRQITSSISTFTAMINTYYDLGQWRGLVPYVGAGIGIAYNMMEEYRLPPTPTFPNTPVVSSGDNDLALAWSLMAGAGYQISDRAIFDFGYRYISLGHANTARNDNFGQAQTSRLSVEHQGAHEFKVGLRYHFGANNNCCASYQPLK